MITSKSPLESRYLYNLLHNDLDAYTFVYGIATLMTNLLGRGNPPASHPDDYVTLFHVYEHVINADKLRANRARKGGGAQLSDPDESRVGARPWHDVEARLSMSRA
jgi:hypothetical protein